MAQTKSEGFKFPDTKRLTKEEAINFINAVRVILADCEIFEDGRDCYALVFEALKEAGIPPLVAEESDPNREHAFVYKGPDVEVE